MSTLLFKYELFIGTNSFLANKLKTRNANESDGKVLEEDIRVVPEKDKFILLTQHHFDAEIEFPAEGNGNKNPTQTFEIYNVSPSTEKFIKSGNIIILKAGYSTDENLPTICAAQIIKTYTVKTGVDRVTTIICSEAYDTRRKILFSESFLPKTLYVDIIQKILDVFAQYGVPSGDIRFSDEIQNKGTDTGYILMGNIERSLQRICDMIKHRWYIAGGEIFIEPDVKDEHNDYINLLVVEFDQVKNTIESLDDVSNKKLSETEIKTRGIKFTINLNGNLNRNDGVLVIAREGDPESFAKHEGTYVIKNVKHTLSYEGDSWDTTIEARG